MFASQQRQRVVEIQDRVVLNIVCTEQRTNLSKDEHLYRRIQDVGYPFLRNNDA